MYPDIFLYPSLPSDSSKYRIRDNILLGLPLLTPLCLSGMHIDFPTEWILSYTTKFFSVWGLVEFYLLSGLYELGLPASWVVLTVEWYLVLRLLLHFFFVVSVELATESHEGSFTFAAQCAVSRGRWKCPLVLSGNHLHIIYAASGTTLTFLNIQSLLPSLIFASTDPSLQPHSSSSLAL